MNNNFDFYTKAYNPFIQAGIILGLVVIVILLSKMVNSLGIIEVGERFPWMTAASFMLFFAVFNSVISLSSKNLNRYWGRSIMAFMGLAVTSGLVAYFFSSIAINDAGSYRWIYIVVTFGYLVFLSLMGVMRNIVEFAQREEWNHPRLRRKRGKDKRK